MHHLAGVSAISSIFGNEARVLVIGSGGIFGWLFSRREVGRGMLLRWERLRVD